MEKKGYFVGKINNEEVDEVKNVIKKYTSKLKFINDSDINFIHTILGNHNFVISYVTSETNCNGESCQLTTKKKNVLY